jgi:hypothetical protein
MLPFFLTPAVIAEVSVKAHRDAIKGGMRLWESEAIEKALCDIGVDSVAARRLTFDFCQTFVDNYVEEGAAECTLCGPRASANANDIRSSPIGQHEPSRAMHHSQVLSSST